jgi:hypothetical protein
MRIAGDGTSIAAEPAFVSHQKTIKALQQGDAASPLTPGGHGQVADADHQGRGIGWRACSQASELSAQSPETSFGGLPSVLRESTQPGNQGETILLLT